MTRKIGFLLSLAVAGLIAVNPAPAASDSLGDFFNRLGASAGNPYAPEPAAAHGMQLLLRLWEQNGHDRQKAWIAFFQSPEGQRVVRTPGALKLLTEWFDAVMALPSGQQGGSYPAQVQPSPGPQQRIHSNTQSANEVGGRVDSSLSRPFLGPYRPNAYGPGINSDATGRPFVWQPDQGPRDPSGQVRPDAYGPGIGMDQYGRPVRAACPPFEQNC
jgi:hypothetical protein